jgi:hypothetical protein
MDLPIACTLNEAEMRDRRQAILEFLRRTQTNITELPNGYAYTFAPTSESFMQVTQLVDLERQCCPFLSFQIHVGPGKAPIRLEITGPNEARTLIDNFFDDLSSRGR